MAGVKAVIFDLGGVVVSSPFIAIFEYEKSENIPKGGILNVIKKFGDKGAFAQLERAAISFDDFCKQFKEECTQSGFPTADGRKFIYHIEQCWRKTNPEIVNAIFQLRKNGIKTAALTNNWFGPEEEPTKEETQLYGLLKNFDVVVESRVVKLRKPEEKIYLLACEKLGVSPNQCVYLDDIGSNLKPAKDMGMKTIHVKPQKTGVHDAVKELQTYFDFNVSLLPKL